MERARPAACWLSRARLKYATTGGARQPLPRVPVLPRGTVGTGGHWLGTWQGPSETRTAWQ
eukprot:1192877-Rhodomonas_salina.1